MNAIIIEDEKLAAERLEGLLKDIDPFINVTAKLTSIDESVKWLSQNKTELIFLDIQLSDGLSFAIFDRVKVDTPIIFTTAYDQYAIRAFKLNSVDYLLKPIKKKELSESIAKIKQLRSALLTDFEEILKTFNSKEKEYKKRFLIQYGQKIKKVETKDIAYFYAMDKNVFIVTFDKSTYPADQSLDKLQEIIDPDKYFRINRKLLINCDAIKNMIPFSRSRIKIDLDPPAPKEIDALVSVERSHDFKAWMDR